MTKKLILNFIALGTVIMLSGCLASGQKFQSFEKNENENEATVYFYRPNSMIGVLNPYNVMNMKKEEDGTFSIKNSWKLRNSSFTVEKLTPGRYFFTTNVFFTPRVFDFNANEIVCIKLDITPKVLVSSHPNLIKQDLETCRTEIQEVNKMTKEDLDSLLY